MPKKQKLNPVHRVAPAATLATVASALASNTTLSPTRRRDLRSAVRRTATLLRQPEAAIILDLASISTRLSTVNPIGEGMSAKTMANLRSDLLAAIRASGLLTIAIKPSLSPDWMAFLQSFQGKRLRIGLSRLARFASGQGIAPEQVTDQVIERFISAVQAQSLHRKPRILHRHVTRIWNEAVERSELKLTAVTVPSFKKPPKRIAWALLSPAFHKDELAHLAWCGGADPFAPDARSRRLAKRTLRLRHAQIHAAVTALVDSGVKPAAVRSLRDLVTPENLKRILRRRLAEAGGAANAFNRDLAEVLVQIAREWVKLKPLALAQVRQLASKMPLPPIGLTPKNKAALRQFDDPAVRRRLMELPARLWIEVRREAKPNFRTLAKAQVALAIAMLSYMPIRSQNLTALIFDVHLFLAKNAGAISTLELSETEVKNDNPIGFDIPPLVAKLLLEYRDRIAPKVIGHRPERLFCNADGSPKSQATVAWLIRTYLRQRAGIILSPHQFRHLSAKTILDEEPGAYEIVAQMLGHKNRKTTVNSYAGIDARRAGRHHQLLIDRALERQQPIGRRRRKPRSDEEQGG